VPSPVTPLPSATRAIVSASPATTSPREKRLTPHSRGPRNDRASIHTPAAAVAAMWQASGSPSARA